MKNKIEDLRNHLFATLEHLRDPERPMEIDRARAIADVAKVIVDSAKAEVDYMKVAGVIVGTGFIDLGGTPKHGQLPAATPQRCSVCTVKTSTDPCHSCGTRLPRGAA